MEFEVNLMQEFYPTNGGGAGEEGGRGGGEGQGKRNRGAW